MIEMMELLNKIDAYKSLAINTIKDMKSSSLIALIQSLEETRQRGAVTYIMGNGGSAATASHFANDFNKGLSEHLEKKFRFKCLNDNIPTMLAIANDIGYDRIFEFQLQGIITAEDLIIGISGSGNSSNVLRAIELAKSVGATTVGLTGFDGGKLHQIVDISIHIPVMSMQVTEDIHMMIDHLIMAVLYKELCGIDHLKD